MTEFSYPWAGTATGDAGTYSDDQWSDAWRHLLMFDRAASGPIVGVLNELEVTGVTSPVAVATGVALVDGKIYTNDASENVAIPTPTTNPRIDRIVLRKDWSAQTVRITRIAGSEAASPSAPAITQNDGVTWDVSLAQVHVTTGGVVTVTDEREFTWTPLSLLRFLFERDTPNDGEMIVADSAVDGGSKFIPRVRIASPEVFSYRLDESVEILDDAFRLPIPDDMDGYELVYVKAHVKDAPSGGAVEVELTINGVSTTMLSTNITIDDGETSSDTAATPPVIKTNGDENVDGGDEVYVNVLAANGAVGLKVEMGFSER